MSGRVHADDGMTLTEMLVAMLIIGVAMTALAGSLTSSLRSLSNAERETVATATVMQLLEQRQSTSWDEAGVYEADQTGTGGTDPARWAARLDGSGKYDGMDIVTILDPPTPADRDPLVREPWFTETRQGAEFTVDVYPVWVDLSGDGVSDAKRFIAVAAWTNRFGGSRELVTVSDRSPTQSEAVSTGSGSRILQTSIVPAVVYLDEDGYVTEDVTISVLFNTGITLPKVEFEDIAYSYAHQDHFHVFGDDTTLNMTVSAPATGGGYTRATVVLPADTYRFINGTIEFEITATDGVGDPVVGSTSFVTAGGPWDEYGNTDGVEPTPDPGGYAGPVSLSTTPSVTSICVSNSQWRLTSDVTVTVSVSNLDDSNGTVNLSYPYWSQKRNNDPGAPDQVGTVSGNQTSASSPNSTWSMVMSSGSTHKFAPGESIDFTIVATREDGSSDSTTTISQTISTC